jgi:hypothetical protein
MGCRFRPTACSDGLVAVVAARIITSRRVPIVSRRVAVRRITVTVRRITVAVRIGAGIAAGVIGGALASQAYGYGYPAYGYGYPAYGYGYSAYGYGYPARDAAVPASSGRSGSGRLQLFAGLRDAQHFGKREGESR